MTEEATIEQEAVPAQEAIEPAEQPISDQSETTETPDTSEPSGEDAAADQPKSKGVQKRIDELTANWRSTERDRDYWRDLAMRQMQQGQQQPQDPEQPAPAPTSEKPNPDKFESYDEYVEALTDWKVEQRENQRRQQSEQKTAQQQAQEARRTFSDRAAQVRSSIEDFDSVAFNPALPVSEAMEKVLLASEKGPEVLYQLGKNPREAARIAGLPPHLAALELGKIEARLSIPAPKKTTSAPDPVQPIGSRDAGSANDPSKMSTKEWMEWRSSQLNR